MQYHNWFMLCSTIIDWRFLTCFRFVIVWPGKSICVLLYIIYKDFRKLVTTVDLQVLIDLKSTAFCDLLSELMCLWLSISLECTSFIHAWQDSFASLLPLFLEAVFFQAIGQQFFWVKLPCWYLCSKCKLTQRVLI